MKNEGSVYEEICVPWIMGPISSWRMCRYDATSLHIVSGCVAYITFLIEVFFPTIKKRAKSMHEVDLSGFLVVLLNESTDFYTHCVVPFYYARLNYEGYRLLNLNPRKETKWIALSRED